MAKVLIGAFSEEGRGKGVNVIGWLVRLPVQCPPGGECNELIGKITNLSSFIKSEFI